MELKNLATKNSKPTLLERVKKLKYAFYWKLIRWLEEKAEPTREHIIRSLVMNTAALELKSGEYRYLPPLPGSGVCGPFQLSGNSNPRFEYLVFDKKLMNFVYVKAEISRPDRIQFFAQIKAEDEDHNKEVPIKPEYTKEFHRLAKHLVRYFPWSPPVMEETIKQRALTWQ